MDDADLSGASKTEFFSSCSAASNTFRECPDQPVPRDCERSAAVVSSVESCRRPQKANFRSIESSGFTSAHRLRSIAVDLRRDLTGFLQHGCTGSERLTRRVVAREVSGLSDLKQMLYFTACRLEVFVADSSDRSVAAVRMRTLGRHLQDLVDEFRMQILRQSFSGFGLPFSATSVSEGLLVLRDRVEELICGIDGQLMQRHVPLDCR